MGRVWPALDIHVPACDPQLHDLVLAELDDFQPTAIQEIDEGAPKLRAFFTSVGSRDDAARALASGFGTLLFVENISVEDEDWAARSQSQLHAIRIGRFTVAPPWEPGSDPLFTIIVNPSVGFGTGHHATTRLTLEALQNLPVAGRTVLDIGCGSGVLAIAAAKLGAASATGIDIDGDALDNARENAGLNGSGDAVRFQEADFRACTLRADVVMANLTGALLEKSAAHLAGFVAPGGHLIVSGFMDHESNLVVAALERSLEVQSLAQEQEWMCAVLAHKSGGRV